MRRQRGRDESAGILDGRESRGDLPEGTKEAPHAKVTEWRELKKGMEVHRAYSGAGVGTGVGSIEGSRVILGVWSPEVILAAEDRADSY